MSLRESQRLKRYDQMWEKYGNKNERFNQSVIKTESKVKIGKIHADIEYKTRNDVLEFVPAFYDRYRQGESLKPSVAVIPDWDPWGEDDLDDLSLEPSESEGTKKKIYKELGPIGFKFKTDVMKFEFNRERIDESFKHDELTTRDEKIQHYIGFLYSFQATHALAVITELEVELVDLDYTWEITDESIISYVYDVFEGGSGVTKKIYLDWNSSEKIIGKKIMRLLYPTPNEYCCTHICEKCILLPRTPEFLLRNRLLDKDFVRAII